MRLALLTAVIVLLCGGATATAGDAGETSAEGLVRAGANAEYVPGEVVVRFRSGVSAAARASAVQALGAEVEPVEGAAAVTLVELSEEASVPLAVAALERRVDVLYAEPNYLYRLSSTFPNDGRFGTLWGLHQNPGDHDIDAPEAWDTRTGHSAVVVAVIDSGVAYDHPDLAGNIWTNDDPPGGGDQDKNGFVDDTRGWDFVQNDNVPLDFNGHGTHVAGTIGAVGNNALGITGVNWDVSIMPVRAADFEGALTSVAITNSILYACKEGAHVVNGSFGGPSMSTTVRDAVKSAGCASTLFVFAAGNSGLNLDSTGSYPCELHLAPSSAANVICVAASDEADARASFSNYSGTSVHLAAPGTNINSAALDYRRVGGTTDGFETADGFSWGLRTGGSPRWNRTTTVKHSGEQSLADSPAGNYVNNAVKTIRRTRRAILTGKSGCLLDYHLRLATQLNRDFFEVWAWPNRSTAVPVAAWSGSTSGGFVNLVEDLSAIDGQSSGDVSFVLRSDGSGVMDGAYVDDMVIACLEPGANVYQSADGTSMATPFVAGVAGLLLSKSGLTVAELKAAILSTVDPVAGLAGVVSTGGRLNANAALASVGPDLTAPETTIAAGPSGLSNLTGFGFRASEPATFACSLDGGSWDLCSGLQTYSGLTQGAHTFEVKATDLTGNEDLTPASRTWTLDTVAPNTSIARGPKGKVKAKKATFTFKATETRSTFECKLDAKAFKACKPGVTYTKLKKGKHTFQVRAKDRAGNVDRTPATRTWTVR